MRRVAQVQNGYFTCMKTRLQVFSTTKTKEKQTKTNVKLFSP